MPDAGVQGLSGRDPHEIMANGLGQEIFGRKIPGPCTESVFSIELGKTQKVKKKLSLARDQVWWGSFWEMQLLIADPSEQAQPLALYCHQFSCYRDKCLCLYQGCWKPAQILNVF